MCLAVPGKIISMDNGKAIADFNGNTIPVEIGLVKAKIGDHVLVHAGCVIQVLSEKEHDEIYELLAELEEITRDERKSTEKGDRIGR